jgi:hypothetical protein
MAIEKFNCTYHKANFSSCQAVAGVECNNSLKMLTHGMNSNPQRADFSLRSLLRVGTAGLIPKVRCFSYMYSEGFFPFTEEYSFTF